MLADVINTRFMIGLIFGCHPKLAPRRKRPSPVLILRIDSQLSAQHNRDGGHLGRRFPFGLGPAHPARSNPLHAVVNKISFAYGERALALASSLAASCSADRSPSPHLRKRPRLVRTDATN